MNPDMIQICELPPQSRESEAKKSRISTSATTLQCPGCESTSRRATGFGFHCFSRDCRTVSQRREMEPNAINGLSNIPERGHEKKATGTFASLTCTDVNECTGRDARLRCQCCMHHLCWAPPVGFTTGTHPTLSGLFNCCRQRVETQNCLTASVGRDALEGGEGTPQPPSRAPSLCLSP